MYALFMPKQYRYNQIPHNTSQRSHAVGYEAFLRGKGWEFNNKPISRKSVFCKPSLVNPNQTTGLFNQQWTDELVISSAWDAWNKPSPPNVRFQEVLRWKGSLIWWQYMTVLAPNSTNKSTTINPCPVNLLQTRVRSGNILADIHSWCPFLFLLPLPSGKHLLNYV